ncbi:hypothetical protein NGA75_03615 [Lactococcus formosensis]|uniref:hypothetical protein n=1 Tax=Lactococcus formosensis TaxID=1281486 RepID=UPI002435A519|nr:hypothetical protein [Lactococcus formosensis]MDG6184941.1 hypothetical protein [Lactococcus formosensis]
MPKNAPRGPERLGASKNRRMSTALVLCCAVLCCAVLCCAVLTDYKSSALPRQVFRYR